MRRTSSGQAEMAATSLTARRIENRKAPARCGSGIAYRIASDFEDIAASLHLVHEAYVQRGLIDAHPSGVRVTKYHLLPTSEVLMAASRDGPICTATLVRDNDEFGLPMESIYAAEVASRRDASRKLAETSCLACHPSIKTPLSVVIRLMALTVQCAAQRGVDEVLAVVHPDHADFYTGFLGFDVIGTVKLYPSVRFNPALPISLDLNTLRDKHFKGYKRTFEPSFAEEILRQTQLDVDSYDRLRCLMDRNAYQELCA